MICAGLQKVTCDVAILFEHVSNGSPAHSLHPVISQIQLQDGGIGYQGNRQSFGTLQRKVFKMFIIVLLPL